MVGIGYHWAESFRIIATGLSAYLVLCGLARLVEATKAKDSSSTKSKPSHQHSSASSSLSLSSLERTSPLSSEGNSKSRLFDSLERRGLVLRMPSSTFWIVAARFSARKIIPGSDILVFSTAVDSHSITYVTPPLPPSLFAIVPSR